MSLPAFSMIVGRCGGSRYAGQWFARIDFERTGGEWLPVVSLGRSSEEAVSNVLEKCEKLFIKEGYGFI